MKALVLLEDTGEGFEQPGEGLEQPGEGLEQPVEAHEESVAELVREVEACSVLKASSVWWLQVVQQRNLSFVPGQVLQTSRVPLTAFRSFATAWIDLTRAETCSRLSCWMVEVLALEAQNLK